jgi:hypothetical protein
MQTASKLYDGLQESTIAAPKLSSLIHSTLSGMKSLIARSEAEMKSTGTTNALQNIEMCQPIYRLCRRSVSHLARDILGRQLCGSVNYEIIALFNTILTSIREVCSWMPREGIVSPTLNASDASHTSNSALDFAAGLADLLRSFVEYPEMTESSPLQAQVFEWLLALLLDRLGNLMASVVFGSDSEPPSSAQAESADLGAIPLPTKLAPSASAQAQTAAQTAASLEGYLLARVLRQSLFDDARALRPHIGSLLRAGSAAAALAMLQRTLLRGVFGDDGEVFAQALRPPQLRDMERDETRRDMGRELRTARPGAFVEMLFETVGWLPALAEAGGKPEWLDW